MKFSLTTHPVHLGSDATAYSLPEFGGDLGWYDAYSARTAADGAAGRLVSMFTFEASWDSWEMHPNGHEVVVCISGAIALHQEGVDGTVSQIDLRPGEYAINPPCIWHTADVLEEAVVLFITTGIGTEHRPRVAKT